MKPVRGRPVALLQLGEAMDGLRALHGCYPQWFARVWGDDLHVIDGRSGGPHPDPRAWAGLIISGSPRSLTTVEPWMDDAADLLARAHEAGTPVLGVCFGHQLIGHAFGGRVVENPRGWEIGTCEVHLTDLGAADPLFDGLPRVVQVNLTHRDMVDPESLKGGGTVRVLAANDATEVQAVAVGEHVRGVQFHPEIHGALARAYVDARRALLTGHDPDVVMARTGDSPHGEAVMRNFRRHFVERA